MEINNATQYDLMAFDVMKARARIQSF